MSQLSWRAGVCLAMAVLAAPAALGQAGRQGPRVGFAYPAGGRQGETFEVTVGGQFLKDSEVHLSGSGVEIAVLDYISPLAGKELTEIRDLADQAQKKAREDAKGGRQPGPLVIRRVFLEMAKEKGITEKQIEAFDRYRQQRNDPKRQLNPQLSESVKLRVTISAGAATGTRELRLATRTGLSNPLRFQVGSFAERLEGEPNDSFAAATVVSTMPMVLNGQIMPGDVDRFRLTARRGQRLVMQVSARELMPYLADAVPGWFQATATLYDAGGRQVAYADDYRFDPDPVLLYEVPQDGEYILEIRDSIYRGREDFVYRVTVGEQPFVTGIFPLGAQRGQKTTVTFQGWNLPPDQLKLELTPEETGIRPLSIKGAAGSSNTVPLAVGDLPESLEREPNNDAAHAAELTLPIAVNGRIDQGGDWDVFRFRAREGEEIVAEVQARRLGSPLDSLLKITDAAGQVLGANDDHEDKGEGLLTHQADSLLVVAIPKTGDYLLWIGDAQRQGGAACAYRLLVGPRRPDFQLRVVPSAVNARGGSMVPVTVYALRDGGFSGDIELRLRDAPAGFALSGARIPAGQDKVQVTLTVPVAPSEKLTPLALEGYATVGGREISRAAVPADDMMQAFAYHHLVPAERWVAAIETVRFGGPAWKIETETPLRLKVGGTVTLRVRTAARLPAGQIRLDLSDPPEGVSVQKVTVVAGALEVVLQADAEKAKAGLKGNLILSATVQRDPPKDPAAGTATTPPPPAAANLRVPLGALPAVPYELLPGDSKGETAKGQG